MKPSERIHELSERPDPFDPTGKTRISTVEVDAIVRYLDELDCCLELDLKSILGCIGALNDNIRELREQFEQLRKALSDT